MAAARPATQAYLCALLGRSHADPGVQEPVKQILEQLEQAPESDERAMDTLRSTLGDAIHSAQRRTMNDTELDAAVLALMLRHRDDTQIASPRPARRRVVGAAASPRTAPARPAAEAVRAAARAPPASSVAGEGAGTAQPAVAAPTPASVPARDASDPFPRLSVAAASFTPSAAAAPAFTPRSAVPPPTFVNEVSESGEASGDDDEDDEFSPFASAKAAPADPLVPEPVFVPGAELAVPLAPLDVFCTMLLTEHPELFGDELHTAPQQIQAALERNHYDVQATMQTLQEARRTNTPLIASALPGEMPAQDALGGARVCRYFLAGECRRSDCRFSHDLNKALCRFWLRGQCLNDPCSFLHDFDALSVLASSLSVDDEPPPPPRDEVVVPGIVRQRLDPAQTRWAAAAASPRPARAQAAASRSARAAAPPAGGAVRTVSRRLALRPPTLLPTLSTGTALASEMSKLRAKYPDASWEAIEAMVHARHQRLREQLLVGAGGDAGGWGSSAQASDERGAQGVRGRRAGGGLGLYLGVARAANIAPYTRHALSLEERMEAFLDLHGLYASEAVQATERFLLALEAEHFRGLAYLGVGAGKHSRTKSSKIQTQVRAFLHSWGYPMAEYDGVIVCDPCTHL
ncbi:hypothetical protein MBRA1_001301 [Malassezia brasiliensis]|uniref:Uncharacterized protein n=1 Tax=Malassezia brasiliensis TaxID=1821822 RepID=A0AAF0IN75_9BASI|nr:hypothetical protein MBRA1_001301 [Malassezia brasiliensis]